MSDGKLFATGKTHQQLCDRALRWLSGTRRCEPVFAGIASCSEVPDAIGWSSCYAHEGSTVIECKISRSDFYAERKKITDSMEELLSWTDSISVSLAGD
jgi:hypothetical protein